MKNFEIDAELMEGSALIKQSKKVMGLPLYNKIVKYCAKYIDSREVDISGGYFKFGMVIGNNVANQKMADNIWSEMIDKYGDDADATKHIKKVLGTILMICVANDSRQWVYKDDPDKQIKKQKDEVPEPTEYFMFE